MEAEGTGFLRGADGRVTGVEARTPDGLLTVHADLAIGADGRTSAVRGLAGLAVDDLGAPMDVLWMRLPRRDDDPQPPLGQFQRGRIVITLPRDGYYQCGYIVPKGTADTIRATGLDAFRASIAETVPLLADRTDALATWDDVKLLTVTVDRLREWAAPGLLCIGDAAHAMSPIGGVGINVAVQDAVAAANLLHEPLAEGVPTLDDLRRVQARRQPAVRLMQRLQVALQNRVIRPTLDGDRPIHVPPMLRLLQAVPYFQRIPARVIGMGFRKERVESPDAHPA